MKCAPEQCGATASRRGLLGLFPALLAAGLAAAASGCRQSPPAYHSLVQSPPAFAHLNTQATVGATNGLDPAWLQAPTNFFTLGPGDKVEIQLIGEPRSLTTTVVAPDGKLYFNLLPGIDVWGLTVGEATDQLERVYGQYVRQPPQIAMTLREVNSKRIWVLGRVQVPGIYPLTSPMTLLEAVARAGGTMSLTSYRDQQAAGINEELADLDRSFVVRQGRLLPVSFNRLLQQGDLSQNIYLQPDDFVYFPSARAREVYVMGAVVQPQPVPYREGLTVAGAVAGAFGTLKEAYLSHVAVVRGSLTEPEIAVVNYKKVVRGLESDFALQAGDIVYVPLSPYRYLERYLDVILNTFVSSTAINAGQRLVGVDTRSIGGVFIPVGSGIQVIPPTPVPPIQ